MIITKTPYRLSFLGGGTDYPQFFAEHGGSVLSTTFDKYAYVTARPLPHFFDYNNQIVHSRIEYTKTRDEIEHPLIRNAMKYMDMQNLQVIMSWDLPGGSGLGSSSAFAAGLLSAFHAMKGETVDRHTLASQAIYLERTLCAENGGWQDQIAAAYGGLNRIDFFGNSFTVKPLPMTAERKATLNRRLMIFFTGFSRLSSEIAKEQTRMLGSITAELKEMLSFVDDGENILTDAGQSLDEFGRLLDYTWRIKRRMTSKITTDAIDALYAKAINAGALGGKLMGAGGGGFLLFYVPENRQLHVKEALSDLMHVPYTFGSDGSQLLYSQSGR